MDIYLDATTIKESACLRKLCLKAIDGYSEPPDFKMEYGSAFHIFMKHYTLNGNKEEAILKALRYYTNPRIIIPEKDYRTPEHLLMTCNDYLAYWGADGFEVAINREGKPVVEERFCIQIYRDAERDVNIFLFGMIDRLGKEDDKPTVMDHKVTSDSNYDANLAGYRLSPQMMTYDYALRQLAKMYPDSFGEFSDPWFIIDGIFIKKYGGSNFIRSQQFHFSDVQRNWYEIFLKRLCVEVAVYGAARKDWEHTLSCYPPTGMMSATCDGKYFKRCCFADVCAESDPSLAQMKLEANFSRRTQGPEIFDEKEEMAVA